MRCDRMGDLTRIGGGFGITHAEGFVYMRNDRELRTHRKNNMGI